MLDIQSHCLLKQTTHGGLQGNCIPLYLQHEWELIAQNIHLVPLERNKPKDFQIGSRNAFQSRREHDVTVFLQWTSQLTSKKQKKKKGVDHLKQYP